MAIFRSRQAFTLVEISIVLVIIGLLTGGILYGQELVSQGKNTKQIRQLTELETATNSFRLRYGGLPGDIANATGYFSDYTIGTVANGNSNGRLMGIYGYGAELPLDHDYYMASPSMESVQFYVHLVASGLMGGLRPDGNATVDAGIDCPVMPVSTVSKACALLVYMTAQSFAPAGIQAGHWLMLGYYAEATPVPAALGEYGAVNLMSKSAFFLDTKIDDGKPFSGRWVCPQVGGGAAGQRAPFGSWAYNAHCTNGNAYSNVNLDGYTYQYGANDPGNCYCYYRLMD